MKARKPFGINPLYHYNIWAGLELIDSQMKDNLQLWALSEIHFFVGLKFEYF